MKQINPFDLIDQVNAAPGDILKIAPRVFILVVSLNRHNSSRKDFNYVHCTSKGVIKAQSWDKGFTNDDYSAANYINHSNMIGVSRCTSITKVGHIKLETRITFHNCKKYQWWLTGVAKIDASMANLDQRYTLFADASSEVEIAEYARNEDRNFHSDNGASVAEYALMHWMRKCRDARLMQFRRNFNFGGVK